MSEGSVLSGLTSVAFRQAMSRYASGVAIITTRVDSVDHAMTATAFSSVSLSPPLVLVCVKRNARFHEAITQSGRWAVSILRSKDRAVAELLSQSGHGVHERLHGVAHSPGPVAGSALLDAALATLECETTAVHPAGDHSIFVAQVLRARADPRSGEPLVHFESGYVATGAGEDRLTTAVPSSAGQSVRARPLGGCVEQGWQHG
jgi:flavin reductase